MLRCVLLKNILCKGKDFFYTALELDVHQALISLFIYKVKFI